jgi:predicted amidophosphoribosyltransferase
VPGIKQGETGWRQALLGRLAQAPLPPWTAEVDLVTAAPSVLPRRLLRGFDLGAEAAQVLARRLGRPYVPLLAKAWLSGRQAARTETQRRRLPRRAITLRRGAQPAGTVLLVDDVWTTGTTLLRCAQALEAGGADEVRVLAMFRAL